MLIKEFEDLKKPEIWELSETDDIIVTREDSDDHRVLINFKTYKNIKELLLKLQQTDAMLQPKDQFDFNPYLQDFIDILDHDQFEDITDNDTYFQDFARSIKSGE